MMWTSRLTRERLEQIVCWQQKALAVQSYQIGVLAWLVAEIACPSVKTPGGCIEESRNCAQCWRSGLAKEFAMKMSEKPAGEENA